MSPFCGCSFNAVDYDVLMRRFCWASRRRLDFDVHSIDIRSILMSDRGHGEMYKCSFASSASG
jgi:hypothetical protein